MLDKLEFAWPSMRVALEGHSYLDVPRLELKTKAEAKNFLLSYGYDIDDPIVREELWRLYFESLAFLRGALLDETERIPHEFNTRSNTNEATRLLLDAATLQDKARGKWACAILRVMHIISHLDNDIRLENFHYAREQIFTRFDRFVSEAGRRRWSFSFGNTSIPLIRYIKKQRKERNSIIIKLLSKPQTVVEEIYDSLGFRFITESRFDCYRLINLMFSSGAVSAPNVQPGRSVNSLISYPTIHEIIERTKEELSEGKISLRAAQRKVERLEDENLVSWNELRNPNTSRWYRAIQFTCRQLIVAPDPAFRFWNDLRASLPTNRAMTAALKRIPITLREKRTFYYPFEIQVMDKDSYVESIGGRSRHREYKMKQRLMARNRVLRDLI